MSEPDFPPHVVPIAAVKTRIPRVFGIWGTIVYAIASITAFACMVALPWWTPPWWIVLPTFAYVFVSAGIIAAGRRASNIEAREFMEMLKRKSEENKRRMN